MKINKIVYPGLLTSANLFFGFLAIIEALSNDIISAGWFIIIAGVMDGLDGKLARFTKSGSQFGIQFDSLADVVSFGVAPAVLAYTALLNRWGVPGMLVAFSVVLFSAVRLAKFNLTAVTDAKGDYAGLPTPIAAFTVASFIHFTLQFEITHLSEILIIPLIITLDALMVSGVKYDSLPRFTFKESVSNMTKLIFLTGSIVLIAVFPMIAIFPLSMAIIIHGVIRSILRSSRKPALDDVS